MTQRISRWVLVLIQLHKMMSTTGHDLESVDRWSTLPPQQQQQQQLFPIKCDFYQQLRESPRTVVVSPISPSSVQMKKKKDNGRSASYCVALINIANNNLVFFHGRETTYLMVVVL